MERYNKNLTQNFYVDAFQYIFSNAMGNPIVLSAAPTKAEDMKGNTWGYYSTDLYVRFGDGICLKFTGVAI